MTSEINRCYRALELEPGASLEQVKQAWRELVKVWHPDRFPNDAKMQHKAQERLKAINGAYEILTEFLASGTSPGGRDTTSSDAHDRDEGTSRETKAGGGTPPAPPSRPSATPKKSKARVICLLILAVGVLAYSLNLAMQYRAFANQLSAVRGIHIGDSHDEVKYLLGFPPIVIGPEDPKLKGFNLVYIVSGADTDVNKMPAATKVEDYSEWVYAEPRRNVRLTVEFNKSGFVESLTLDSNYSNDENPYGWGSIAGLHSGDSEDKVLRLGPPSQQNLDGVIKTIEYRDIGIVVTLAKGRAYMVTLKGLPKNKTPVFWRFIRSHFTHG